jgi:hypothetical protein
VRGIVCTPPRFFYFLLFSFYFASKYKREQTPPDCHPLGLSLHPQVPKPTQQKRINIRCFQKEKQVRLETKLPQQVSPVVPPTQTVFFSPKAPRLGYDNFSFLFYSLAALSLGGYFC